MNALAGYGSDSESEEEGSTAQVNENKATVEPIETPIVEAPTTITRVSKGIFSDLPPPSSYGATSSTPSSSTGRIGARLREKNNFSMSEASLVQKFAPIDLEAVRERERRLAEQARDDEELERELHNGASLAQKRAASAARSEATAAAGPLFSAMLPPPKRTRQTVGVDDVLKPADVVELPTVDVSPADAARQANNAATLTTTPIVAPVRTAVAAKPSFAASLVSELESSYTSKPIAAAAFANPKFDPSADYSAYAAASPFDNAMADLPASFVGRHSVTPDAIQTVTAASLLSKTSAESQMEAPQMGEQFTGFAHSESGRRRGNISYLAHHAISNQKELEERWRVGGQARKSTRSRYGF
jgi:hypothetical protein